LMYGSILIAVTRRLHAFSNAPMELVTIPLPIPMTDDPTSHEYVLHICYSKFWSNQSPWHAQSIQGYGNLIERCFLDGMD